MTTEAQLEELKLQYQKDMASLLAEVGKLRQERLDAAKVFDPKWEELKQFCHVNSYYGDDRFTDGEGKYQAWLTRSDGTQGYDVAAMPDELVIRLKSRGLLEVNAKALAAFAGKDKVADDVKDYPGVFKGGSTTLHVEPIK